MISSKCVSNSSYMVCTKLQRIWNVLIFSRFFRLFSFGNPRNAYVPHGKCIRIPNKQVVMLTVCEQACLTNHQRDYDFQKTSWVHTKYYLEKLIPATHIHAYTHITLYLLIYMYIDMRVRKVMKTQKILKIQHQRKRTSLV